EASPYLTTAMRGVASKRRAARVASPCVHDAPSPVHPRRAPCTPMSRHDDRGEALAPRLTRIFGLRRSGSRQHVACTGPPAPASSVRLQVAQLHAPPARIG